MNPYAFRNRLSKFGSPQQLVADASNAQQLPGQAAGNVAGQQNPMGGGNPFANDPAGALGGPMQAPSAEEYVNNVNVGGFYQNETNTNLNFRINPMTGRLQGAAQIPVGDYRNGLTIGASGYYAPNSQMGGADYGAALTFGKRNRVPAPGTLPHKYQFGLTVDSRRMSPGMDSTNMNQIPGMSTLGEPEGNLMLSPQQKLLMMEQMRRQGGIPGEAPAFNPGVR